MSGLRFAFSLAAAPLLACGTPTPPTTPPPPTSEKVAPAASSPIPEVDAAGAHHLLDRFAFGPGPGEVDAVVAMGAEAWFEQQLTPSSIEDPAVPELLEPYDAAFDPPAMLQQEFQEAKRQRQRRKRAMDDGEREAPPRMRRMMQQRFGNAMMSQLVRHIASKRQLQEVMVDFWANHFNVDARKGPVKFVAVDYLETAIRPHALGNFETLLLATAKHPAMLAYLDNFTSTKNPEEGTRRAVRKRGGLNENYARELLELHTLGVDGGYSQNDVVEVARILTGWSIVRPRRFERAGPDGSLFRFRERAHDYGAKTVLGHEFPAGQGEEEGRRLIALLAHHPSTAKHLGRKLCQRFVADQPPADCVAGVAEAHTRSRGDITELLRAVLRSKSFWADAHRGNKVKTPLELVASSIRALGGQPDGTPGLARALHRLGQPLLLQSVPTGYSEVAEDWIAPSSMVARMQIATALAVQKLPGLEVDLDRVVAPTLDGAELARRVDAAVLGGRASNQTLDVIRRQVSGVSNPTDARALALALALGSPEFQHQ